MTDQNYRKSTVFISACAGMLLFGICLISLGSLAPGLREKFNLSDLGSGALFSILPFGILIGSLVFGPIADSRGYRLLISSSCIILGAGFEGIAFAATPGILKLFIFLIGISGGAINGATNALVSDISESGKGANLSLLGVFFGIGALGMPLLLGALESSLNFESITAAIGILSVMTGLAFLLIRLPAPKAKQGFPIKNVLKLLKDKALLLIALFLFFQSSIEGILNNWTTSFMIKHVSLPGNIALFTLSLFVTGMTVMRLLTGTILRNYPVKNLMIISFALILAGIIAAGSGMSQAVVMTAFMAIGAGVASGFPVMLGMVGERYAAVSGTAFSFVLFIALIGNTSLNYAMGLISQRFGIRHFTTLIFIIAVILIMLFFIIVKNFKRENSNSV
jgi:MFS transporter, FHS family, glucose/mannose:H+ symporter